VLASVGAEVRVAEQADTSLRLLTIVNVEMNGATKTDYRR